MSSYVVSALLAIAAVFTCVFILWIAYQLTYWQRRGIVHVKPHFFYGNLKGVMEHKHFAEVFRETYRRFKGTAGLFAGFYMLFMPTALIMDLDLAKRILIKDFHSFSERGFFYNERDDPLSAHIFSLPTNEWRQLRAKLTPAFSTGKLRLMLPTMLTIGERMVSVVNERFSTAGNTDMVITMELKDLYDRFTTDLIGCCVFGLECNSLEDPHTEFRTMNQNLFDNPRNYRAVDGLLYAFPKFARFMRLKQIPDITSDFYFKIVRETIAYREENDVKRQDLMAMLMQLKAEGALSLDEIVANAFLFFFAGFETSSTTMTLALYELAQNPTCQERARREILETLPRFHGQLTYECLQELPYLEQVINETLRLHTIIPQLQRIALKSYEMEGHPKHYISKGTLVILPIEAIHHDPDIFEFPEKFQPERFSAENVKKRHPMAWMPFGDGPRNCMGMHMGKLQMRLGLALLLRHYRFTVSTKTPKQLQYYLQCPFLVPKCGIYLGVERVSSLNVLSKD